MAADTVVESLIGALHEYQAKVTPSYDEVLNEVTAHAQQTGSLGKTEIGALVVWKRLNASTKWATRLMNTPNAEVRAVTAAARQAADDTTTDIEAAARAARAKISVLPGFRTGDALASAVLCALVPHRLAVYDRRAHAGLRSLGVELSDVSGRYGRYMVAVEQLRARTLESGHELTVRDVDLALYTLGKARARYPVATL